MAQAELNITLREESGKGVARKLRAKNLVPAVVYGKGMVPCVISFAARDLEKALSSESGWNTLITLKGAAAVEDKVVVLKDLKRHPIHRNMICADFHAIDLNKKVIFMVPVVSVGTSVGEKEGGTLQIIRHELEVLCLPTAVPQSIEIDVTALKIGDVVHVKDVTVPEGAEVSYDVNFTVLTVLGHKDEEEDLEAEESAEVEAPEADKD